MTRIVTVAIAALAPACASTGAGGAPACVVPGSGVIDTTQVGRLAGTYRITQVATFGQATGATATGRLVLHANTAEMTAMRTIDGSVVPGVVVPYYGSLEITDDVGALTPGDPASTDPQRPGALMIVRGPDNMLLRIGADANDRRGPTPIESTYLIFRIRSLARGRFTGTWASGMREDAVRGYFCADLE